ISSLIKYTNRVGVLIDGEAVVMRPGSVEVFGFDGSKREPRYVAVDWSVQQASKLGHPHYLRKEIEEEPQAIHGLIKSVRSVETDIRRFIRSRKVNKVVFLACGSASFSGAFASILARRWRLPLDVMSDIGSEFRYLPTHMDRQSLLVAVSQSGETADTLGAVDHAEAAGAGIMSFVNVVGSSLERRCDCSVRLAAGPEIAVPSTKAVMNQFLAATLVICLLRENSKQSVDLWQMQSERIADCIGRIISMESEWRQTASRLASHQHCFALGRGLDYPIALETGLKFKETAYIHGEAMYAGEFKHGSISLIEPEMPVVCFLGDRVTRQKTISNIEEIKARGAQPFLIAPGDGESLAYLGVEHRLPELDEPWASIMQLAAAHLMCYHAGVLRNVTVDRPRNLAKSVTVE
ncbi:MAG: SIS domain-containing protein, partial [Rhodoplanes sp.]